MADLGRIRKFLLCAAIVAGSLVSLPSTSGGQSVSDTERELTGPDTIDNPCEDGGFSFGIARICPAMAIGYQWSGDDDRETGLLFNPSIRARATRPALSISGGASTRLVIEPLDADLGDADANVDFSLRALLMPRTRGEFDASYSFTSEAPSSTLSRIFGAKNEHYAKLSFGVGQRIGAFLLKADAAAGVSIFEDVELRRGGGIDNSRRNHFDPELALRVTYLASAMFQPFVEAAYTPRIYFADTDRNGRERDAQGFELLAGVTLAGSPTWRGEAAVILAKQFYSEPSIHDRDAIGLNLDVTWMPDAETEAVISAATMIEQATAGDVSGVPTYAALLKVTRAIGEDTKLAVSVYGEYQDLPGQGSDLTFITPKLSASVALAEPLVWTTSYEFTWFDSSAAGSDIFGHLVRSGFELRL